MSGERVGFAKRRRCDLEAGPKGGTFRRRRVFAPVEVEGARWVVARVMSGFEFAVADDLAVAGFRTFAPFEVRRCFRSRLRGSEKRVASSRDYPVFAGYVFVGCPPGLLLSKQSHSSVLDVLGEADGLAVSHAAMRALSEMQGSGAFETYAPSVRQFAMGNVVRVLQGPFAERLGRVEAMLPRQMLVRVALQMFGGRASVTMAAGQVELAGV